MYLLILVSRLVNLHVVKSAGSGHIVVGIYLSTYQHTYLPTYLCVAHFAGSKFEQSYGHRQGRVLEGQRQRLSLVGRVDHNLIR